MNREELLLWIKEKLASLDTTGLDVEKQNYLAGQLNILKELADKTEVLKNE